MIQKIIKSLAITSGVGLLLAWPTTFLGIPLIGGFSFFVVLQFVAFYFYNDYIQNKIAIKEAELLLEREKELSKQGAELICPCDKRASCFVPINLNDENNYICPGCNKQVSVYINFKTAIATIPVTETPEEVIKKSL